MEIYDDTTLLHYKFDRIKIISNDLIEYANNLSNDFVGWKINYQFTLKSDKKIQTYFSYFVILCVLNKIFPQGLSMTLLGALIYLNLLQAVFGVFEAVVRSKGRPAFGIYASNSLRLSEFLGVLTGLVLFSNSLISIAICAIVSKTLVFITIVFVQRKHFTILKFSFIDFPILKS